METKRVLGIIFGSLAVLIFAFVLTWGIINFNKVKDGMSGTGLYTKEDLNNSYDDGYNTALMDKAEYEALIGGYRDTITNQTDQISKLNSQITTLNNSNKDYKNQIQSLNNTITTKEETISNLQSLIDTNNTTIAELETEIANKNNQIIVLNKEITALETENNNKTAEIQNKQNQVASLNNQVNSLQNLVNQLNSTNETNLATINTLNNQIQSLNTQISDLKLQINNNDTNVTDLNNKIADLEKSVAYYEQYIANLESDSQVVATFEFDNSVYNIQIVNKGAYVSVVAPTSTDYIVFNGWKVNNEIVNLDTYAINENTKFVADVTYKYDVKFSVDNVVSESQIIEKDTYAIAPTTPIKTGYEFNGWTVDGVNLVDISTYKITSNTTFTAVFTKMHNVTFVCEDTTISTQSVKNGAYAENVYVESTTYKVFNGWLVNGTTVDVSTYKISADTVFVADITYKYDVIFMVDDVVYNTQIVEDGNYATMPETPTKTGYEFEGWTINNVDVISDISISAVTQNTIYVAKFIKIHTVTFVCEDTTISTQSVKNGAYAENVSVESTTYKVFNGWLVNGTTVDISTYKISADTVFVADITYKYDVTFMVDDVVYNSQIILKDNYATLPENPSKEGYEFNGWTLNNTDTVNVLDIAITNSTIFYAVFNESSGLFIDGSITKTWEQCVSEEIVTVSGDTITDADSNTVGELRIPSSITSIGKEAFSYCKFTNIVLPSSITSIGIGSFSSMHNLTEIDIPSGITVIPDSFAKNSDKLQKITLREEIISIGNSAFYGCSSLAEVNFAQNSQLTKIGVSCFYKCKALTTITIPNGVTYIGDSCFYMCTSLVSAYLSDNIKTIQQECFYYCTALTTIKLPINLQKINVYSFYRCTSLKTIYIPTSVTDINCLYDDGDLDAIPFEECENLVVYCGVSSAPSGYDSGWDSYGYLSKEKLTVKYGYTYEQYLQDIGE